MKNRWSSEELQGIAREQQWMIADLFDRAVVEVNLDLRPDKMMAYQLSTIARTMHGERPVATTGQYEIPSSPWEMLKGRLLPSWLLKVWPIRTRRVHGPVSACLQYCSPQEWEEFKQRS